jgi:uncharacterized protein YbjT (DUF2867 family)
VRHGGIDTILQVVSMSFDEDTESRQGKALIDEALKASVKLFVYSSVDRGGDNSFNNPTNIKHFNCKHQIEQHLIASTQNGEMDWTILRPTAFYDNLSPNFFGKVFATSWKTVVKDKPLQLIAVSDIGIIAAKVFMRPANFKGRGISLAGDDLTFVQMADIYKKKTGKDIALTYGFICSILMWMVKDVGVMFQWFHDEGYKADITELRKLHPGLKDFGMWLEADSQFIKH